MVIKRTLPIIEPFRISSLDWDVFDQRDVSDRASELCSQLWLGHVRDLTKRNDSLNLGDICGVSAVREDLRVSKFRAALADKPGLDWRTFRDEGGGLDREFDIDGRLPQIFLCVKAGAEWIGGIPISNIHIESENSETIVANAFFFNGVPGYRDLSTMQTWIKIFQRILDFPLSMKDGRTLEVVQYSMLSSPEQRAVMNDDPDIKELMNGMRPLFDSLGDPANRTAPILFRRRTSRR